MLQAHVRRLFYSEKIILRESSIETHAQLIRLYKEKQTNDLAALMTDNWLYTLEEI